MFPLKNVARKGLISAESAGWGWCKIEIATQWFQLHVNDKCGFLFMPWISVKYNLAITQNLKKKYAPV